MAGRSPQRSQLIRAGGLTRAGFCHGFSLRAGGVSAPPYDSLNLGRAVGDAPAAVAENHARFAAAVGYAPGQLFEVSQVHGARVRRPFGWEDPALVRGEQADALVAAAGAVAVGVRVADCAPVLLADADSGCVAAVHAGWRGVARGVVREAVESLRRLAGGSGDLHAAVFPHIRSCCFEVGPEVAAQLQAAAPGLDVVRHDRPTPHVVLDAVVRSQLLALGLAAERIEVLPGCTRCEPERFFSYRRDAGRSGRHVAAIVSGPLR